MPSGRRPEFWNRLAGSGTTGGHRRCEVGGLSGVRVSCSAQGPMCPSQPKRSRHRAAGSCALRRSMRWASVRMTLPFPFQSAAAESLQTSKARDRARELAFVNGRNFGSGFDWQTVAAVVGDRVVRHVAGGTDHRRVSPPAPSGLDSSRAATAHRDDLAVREIEVAMMVPLPSKPPADVPARQDAGRLGAALHLVG